MTPHPDPGATPPRPEETREQGGLRAMLVASGGGFATSLITTILAFLVDQVLRQISPLCMEGFDPTEHWGPGLSAFMGDFMKWIESYLIEWDMIDFHPDAPKPEPAVG